MNSNAPVYGNASDGVNCFKCRHFATSWDPAMPYSCKLLGFKSKMLPCIQVKQADGRACQGFDAKPAVAAAGARVSVSRQ